MNVLVELHTTQISDGRQYAGHVKIADTSLAYGFTFSNPIVELETMEPVHGDELRKRFQLSVKNGDTDVDLTMDEYGFFLRLILAFIVDFYYDPQTRSRNEGEFGAMVRGHGPLALCGGSVSIGAKTSGSYDFDTELCAMLSQPKFGCVFSKEHAT